ncbi:MAG: Zn-dependent exopeptidase M28 [Ignavibacterium sp.]
MGSATYAQSPFSQDSAYAHLKILAGEIGPRPMGSPSERAAMEYAVEKFRAFGLDEAYIMPLREASTAGLQGGVNTNSGIAVGVLKGKTDRVIVIGGHIDSASPEIPGANDDGSGSACVIELARVLKLRNNESTVVFALFGGEEQGLVGSKYFVKYFDRMDDVDLMLQIDMTNGSEWLLPLTEAGDVSTPEWLVRAAYEEFDALGYTGLSYPTHFYTFMHLVPGGGIGSDHQPFLERGIPAIDFTSDVTDPIHTPQDNLENFIASGLKRSGDLVHNLFVRFDAGTPEERTGSYYLIQHGSLLLFFPTIVLWIFLFIALSLSVVALLEIRKRRVPEEPKRKIPGLKLFLLAMIIQTCVWTSENLVGLISGRRFPWVADPDGYFILGLLAGIFGIWVSMLVGRKLDVSTVAYRYALRSSIFLLVFILLLSLVSVKLAFYPATALALLALTFLVRQRFVRLVLWLLSGHFMFRLIFSEGFYLFARTTSQLPAEGTAPLFLHIFYILFFSLWSFPFLLAFAAIWWDSPSDMQWLSAFGRPAGGIATGVAVIAFAFYLSTRPAYSDLWKQTITVRQTISSGASQGLVTVTSPDYLDGAVISVDGRDTTLQGRITSARLAEFDPGKYEWIKTERTVETRKDSTTTFSIGLRISSRTRPYTLSVTYAGGRGAPQNVVTPLLWSQGPNSMTFRWYSFPDTSLYIPVSFSVTGSDTVREYIEAVFLEQPVSVQVRNDHSSVLRRNVLEKTTILSHEK